MVELPYQPVLEDVGRVLTEKMVDDLETILVDGGDLDKFFLLGTSLLAGEKEQLLALLCKNINVFSWSAYETLGLDQVCMSPTQCLTRSSAHSPKE
ncbi:hypothetical protein ACSBR1_035460 [Camellia fascicularis]